MDEQKQIDRVIRGIERSQSASAKRQEAANRIQGVVRKSTRDFLCVRHTPILQRDQ
jgi:hypothetical protein